MATNYKQLYKLLKTQKNDILKTLAPEQSSTPVIPADFNQTGWELTIQQVEIMLEKMKEANAEKGKRMTPQFFRAVFNRANSTIEELDKAKETRQLESSDFDFQAACAELSTEIADLMSKQNAAGDADE